MFLLKNLTFCRNNAFSYLKNVLWIGCERKFELLLKLIKKNGKPSNVRYKVSFWWHFQNQNINMQKAKTTNNTQVNNIYLFLWHFNFFFLFLFVFFCFWRLTSQTSSHFSHYPLPCSPPPVNEKFESKVKTNKLKFFSRGEPVWRYYKQQTVW